MVRLSGLPALRRLHLSHNPIPSLLYPTQVFVDDKSSPHSQHPATADVSTLAASSTTAALAATAPATAAAGGHVHASQADAAAGAAHTAPSAAAFSSLEALFLGQCQLSRWQHVDELDKFPALKELRLSGNPVLANAKSGGRFEVGMHVLCNPRVLVS